MCSSDLTYLECGTWESYEKDKKFLCYGQALENCTLIKNNLNTEIQECACNIDFNTKAVSQRICSRKIIVYEIKNWGYNKKIRFWEGGMNNESDIVV